MSVCIPTACLKLSFVHVAETNKVHADIFVHVYIGCDIS